MVELQTNKSWDGTKDVERFDAPKDVSETVLDDGRPPELKAGMPIKRVPSDDCLLYPNKTYTAGENGGPRTLEGRGEGVVVHEGEWIEIVPMAQMLQYLGLEQEDNESFLLVCEGMSKRLVRWKWTDMVGEPYPQPFRNPAALRALEDDELTYLIGLFRSGEAESQVKKD